MGILDTLLSLLGLGDSSDDERRETTVSVEREANTDTEAAVKGTDVDEGVDTDEASATGTDAAASTDSLADGRDGPDEADAGRTEPATTGVESADETADDLVDDAEGEVESVEVIKGIGPAYAERLSNAGVNSVADLAAADATELAASIDLSETRVGRWIERAQDR